MAVVRAPATGITARRVESAREWNELVASFPAHDLRLGFEWGEMRREQGWQPDRIAVLDRDGCVAACSLQWRSLPGLGAVLYAPRGPLFHADRPDGLARLLTEVRTLARRRRGVFLRISPGLPEADHDAAALLAAHGFVPLPESWTPWNAPRHVQLLDLRPTESELLAGMRRRYRQYIANIGHKGVVVEPSDRPADLEAFHRLMVRLGELKGFAVRGLPYYRALVDRYRPTGAVTVLMARREGHVIGGLIGFRFGRRAYIHYSSVRSDLPDAVKHGVAPLMFWEFFRRARAEGCELVDLGSSGVRQAPDPPHPNYGVYTFKTGLGCTLEALLPFHDLVFRPLAYRAFRLAETRLVPALVRAPALVRLLKRLV
jgi:lipid II:glycine glycyltransferase (peptidoglycan interpeptide bridge formation enzyme)